MADIATLHKEIGEGMSVSWGTMLDADLIEAFLPYIELYLPERTEVIKEGNTWLDRLNDPDDVMFWSELADLSSYVNETLFDLMDSLAPDGMYFGAHPGDGSEYGWWIIDEPDGEYW